MCYYTANEHDELTMKRKWLRNRVVGGWWVETISEGEKERYTLRGERELELKLKNFNTPG